jgi:hypothetical protein
MKKREGKSSEHVFLRDWTQKWADRLWAFVDLSYITIAAADFLFAKLAMLSKLLPAKTLKDDRKNDA